MDFPVYKKDSDFSYTLGAFPSLEILQKKPSLVEHVLIHTSFVARPCCRKNHPLCTNHSIPWSEQDKVFRRLSPKENCFVIAASEKKNELE
jgi:TrmH family RNA methyltransferase